MEFDYKLLAKYILGELSHNEMEEIMRWRNLSAENEKIFSDLIKLRISWNYENHKDDKLTEKALKKVNKNIAKRKNHKLLDVVKYAASILLFLAISYGGYRYFDSKKYYSIELKKGSDIKKITLADGTTVWLKDASSIRVPVKFSKDRRNIFLKGEAFFDVAKDKNKPFYVSTNYLNVKVLGTAFDIKTDDVNKKVETALLRGKVMLLDINEKEIMDMSPGDKVTYSRENNKYTTETIDANIATAWHLNQTIFENATLREIANKLTAKYNINVNVESSQLAQRRFRCVINQDESLDEVLNLLKYMAPISYKIEGNEVFIWELKNK